MTWRPPACPLHQPYQPPASSRFPVMTNHSSRTCGHHRTQAASTGGPTKSAAPLASHPARPMAYRIPTHGCAATDADRLAIVIADGTVPVEYVALLYWCAGRL